MRQIILDTETTGFRPGGIVSIAAIEMDDNELTGAFAHYHVNPKQPCDPGATKAHGLTDEYLATCPTFTNIIAPLDDFLGSSPIVAHNAPFDMNFLEAEYRRESEASALVWRVVNPVRCTLAKAEVSRGRAKGRNTLDALAAQYGIENLRVRTGKHGALVDCLMLFNVYRALSGMSVVDLVPFLPHYLSAGFGVHGPFQQDDSGRACVLAPAEADSARVPADLRPVG